MINSEDSEKTSEIFKIISEKIQKNSDVYGKFSDIFRETSEFL